jgi:hypothetical protein
MLNLAIPTDILVAKISNTIRGSHHPNPHSKNPTDGGILLWCAWRESKRIRPLFVLFSCLSECCFVAMFYIPSEFSWHNHGVLTTQAQNVKTPHDVGLYIGAPGGSRTPNLFLRTESLYPLSYRRLWGQRPRFSRTLLCGRVGPIW